MAKKIKHRYGIVILLMIVSIFGCKPDPEEFARPENLAGTISIQLESMGSFNYYLQSLGQTQYLEPLAKGGSWTVFAPTDEAFEKFMTDNGFTTFESIPEERILDLVQNSIITDGWNTTTLTYFRNRFYLGQSFRRRTQYEQPNREFNPDTLQHIIDWDKLDPGNKIVWYSNGRLKTVNYFLDSYMDTWGVENEDYDFMFPGETFTDGDMKVFGTNVSQQNVIAENGIIYALDQVIEPQKNLYENLTRPEYGDKYSMFRKMMERFTYLYSLGDIENPDTGVIEEVFQWRVATGIEADFLPFNPFDENYATNIDGTLAQAWGLLVPTNEALTNYLEGNSILGQYYDSYDDMPLDVLGKFVRPNFFRDYYNIVPSSFGQSYDYGLGFVDYKAEDVVDKRFCSNGLFVGVNTVYTNDSFGTIMGPLLLDPNYYIMLKSVQSLGIDTALQSKGVRFTILGVKNDQFDDVADPNSATRRITVLTDPEYFDPENPGARPIYMQVEGDPSDGNNRIYPDPTTTSPSSAEIAYVQTTLNAIVLNQIINEDVDFNGSNFYQTRSGEFVETFNGNSAAGGGDIQVGQSAQIENTQETDNGNFYEMSSIINTPLYFTYGTLVENAASYSSFIEVLETADALIDIVGSSDKLIKFLNLQRTFSLFAPNNAAVAKAISDGVIVEPSTVAGIVDEVEKAIAIKNLFNFAEKHFIQQAMSTDGKTSGTFSSMYYSKIVDFAPVYDEFLTVNTTTSIKLTNEETGASVTTSGVTNLLSKRVVIHEIDNYIK